MKFKTAILERHLRSHDADIVDDNSGLRPQNSFIVVPFTTSASEASLYAKGDVVATVVTDFWVERCIFQKRDEDPGAHVLNTPFPKFLLKGIDPNSFYSDIVNIHECRVRRHDHLFYWIPRNRITPYVKSREADG